MSKQELPPQPVESIFNGAIQYTAILNNYAEIAPFIDAHEQDGQISELSVWLNLDTQVNLMEYAAKIMGLARNYEKVKQMRTTQSPANIKTFLDTFSIPGSSMHKFLSLPDDDEHYQRGMELRRLASSSTTERDSRGILDTVFSGRDKKSLITGITLLSPVILDETFDLIIDSKASQDTYHASIRKELRTVHNRVDKYLETKLKTARDGYMQKGEARSSFDPTQSEGSIIPVALAIRTLLSEPELLPSSHAVLLSRDIFGKIDEGTRFALLSSIMAISSDLLHGLRQRRDSNGGDPYKIIAHTFGEGYRANYALKEQESRPERGREDNFTEQFDRAADYLRKQKSIPVIPVVQPGLPGISLGMEVHGEGETAILDLIVYTSNGHAFAIQYGREKEDIKALSTYHTGNMQIAGENLLGIAMEYINSKIDQEENQSLEKKKKERSTQRGEIIFPHIKIPRPQLLGDLKNERIKQFIEEDIHERNAKRIGLQGMQYLYTEKKPTFIKYYYDAEGKPTHALIVSVEEGKTRGEAVACETEWVPVVLDQLAEGREKIKLLKTNPYKAE